MYYQTMFKFLRSLFQSKPKQLLPDLPAKQKRDEKRYEIEKKQASSKHVKDRLTLAKNDKTHQEILYYLAEKDPDDTVRKAVAENPSTPLQAGQGLAKDNHPDVRLALATRLVSLLPHLNEDTHSQIYAYIVQALSTLALDEVLKIRIALSSTLKDIAQTPPKVANTLARDIEKEVAAPILKYCAALSDNDLIDILKGHPESWAIQAVANRETVSQEVSSAVIETSDPEAGALLMQNQGAIITQIVIEAIIEKAKKIPEWQEPLAKRPSLPPEIAKELASFAHDSVKNILTQRDDFDHEVSDEISKVFERLLELANENEIDPADMDKKLKELEKNGRLNEDTLLDYLGMRNRDMTIAILAKLVGTTTENIKRIVDMQAAKPIIAISWKAGLSMRAALQLEKNLAFVDPKSLIYPRDGTEYPFQEDELEWQLEFLGLKAA